MIKQSICYPLFKTVADSAGEFCRVIAEIGYDGIDLWSSDDVAILAEPAREHGLTITGFPGHVPIEKGLSDPARHTDIHAALRQSIDLASSSSVPTLIAFTGNRIPGQTDMDGLVQCAKGLRAIAPYAEEHGVTICVELLNSKIDHPLYLADRSDFGIALCEMVDSPAVKLLFDVYHMQVMEGNVTANLRRGLPWIGHVHTAGVPGRKDLDDQQELNYSGIVRALNDAGFSGFVGHEFWAKDDKVAAMRHAYQLCAL